MLTVPAAPFVLGYAPLLGTGASSTCREHEEEQTHPHIQHTPSPAKAHTGL